MTKAATNFQVSAKPITDTSRLTKAATGSAPNDRISTNSQGNSDYESAGTAYNQHLLYNAHIYYIGRDPNLIPGSSKGRDTSARISKPLTNSGIPS